MKKGEVAEGIVEKIVFPNKGILHIDGKEVVVKDVLRGQQIRYRASKVRKDRIEGRLLEVLAKAKEEIESPCPHFGDCGGCTYQNLPYDAQLQMKSKQVQELLSKLNVEYDFLGIKGSPIQNEYRNKMEFTFGDAYKGGELTLGMHKRGGFYDIVTVDQCLLVDEDCRLLLDCVKEYYAELNIPYFHRMTHIGVLRHLLIRKAQKTGEILVVLVTTTQQDAMTDGLVKKILDLEEKGQLKGVINGILHVKNDSLADVVQSDETVLLYGKEYFYEELLGLRFKISPFSFFQTNSLGAEVLYKTVRDFVGNLCEGEKEPDKVVFDLYSGTGTIAQMLAPVAKKVVGVEIIPEAVEAAKENAELNGLHNCEFIAGDVLKVLDTLVEKPDYIILDPPRDGIHPKAIGKIIAYGVERLVYISCKPTSLVRDLEIFIQSGYQVEKVCLVDMFPSTVHVESVVLLTRKEA